jgi:hypothetical protein
MLRNIATGIEWYYYTDGGEEMAVVALVIEQSGL